MACRSALKSLRSLATVVPSGTNLARSTKFGAPVLLRPRRWQTKASLKTKGKEQTIPGTEGEEPNVLRDHQASTSDAAPETQGRPAGDATSAPAANSYDPKDSSPDMPDLFIGYLPFALTPQELAASFSKYGEIDAHRIITTPEGHSRGFGYIKFKTETATRNALAADGLHEIGGRPVRIDIASSKVGTKLNITGTGPIESSTVYIGNLAFETSEGDLTERFPEAQTVRIPVMDNGRSRGFGFLTFATQEEASEFVAKNQDPTMLHGRYIRIGYANPQYRPRAPMS